MSFQTLLGAHGVDFPVEDNPQLHFEMAAVYAEAGDTERATAEYLSVLRIEPGHSQALHNLALIFLDMSSA